ncbi:hypothetical protein LAV84_25530 [Rhizobium sp. VS19-DR104.2]|uniref:8-oxoguanine DNA glycosylase OGG fold protein n=1 Tax=unclassified Rhizobium TaxID=2613769 RepID=UPI001C5B51DC|nr:MULTISPECIES: hypothetical protein [unclassified Rhizobium]MBZ5762888.1 hypothetical protein [Rhizobium sp. VS19-DR96]MBZ5768747.1 hypothetical protein [Rhizobium sp. VS19-DR129.2]MBZ5776320.1 hypothetical protein [Rhizobium sp. VS19-DRK62.2]MBZ5787485.1 hypothetical protein [Rhizobium sp. VS19-DR121]MBZ5804883.1 hypothetical protein [Rhizobium sp. VS19-DR181]
MIEKHVAFLIEANATPPAFDEAATEGEGPRSWFEAVKDLRHNVVCGDLDVSTNRARLLSMAADRDVGTARICVSVLAWGGMRPANRNHLFERDAGRWLNVAEDVRSGELDRRGAYERFAMLRSNKDGPMRGMGPAYFTKLIYFLMPRAPGRGYILDQWAGLSINLISGRELVKMDEQVLWKRKGKSAERVVSSRVSDANTAEDYGRYCEAIESLSRHLGPEWTPGQTERALMSGSGERWRNHVVSERFGSLPKIASN